MTKSAFTILFSKPFPRNLFREHFQYEGDLNVDGTDVVVNADDRNWELITSIVFSSDGQKAQDTIERFLRWASLKAKLDDLVWAYQVECVIKEKVNIKLKIPSVLPMVGNVMLTGLVIANVKNLNMNQRKFVIVQIDNDIRVVKRDEKYVSLSQIRNDIKDLLTSLQKEVELA